ncbi:YwbE family protein [Paenibacillus sp. PR3]|uniref:YwbE family protein n=1 Tax=Paenibacillus terricola TaxID=2763503 RepID=A0ABR8N2X6_9BACL|nr:YwbE family protein [Paenibacillus terricola]MBD3922511.1 YwbE family protein [Paenibacillus terricola]
MSTNGTIRANIKPGMQVDIVLKQDQRTGRTTRGIVKDLLTNSPQHPHGIKVRLADGQVGRVKQIVQSPDGSL